MKTELKKLLQKVKIYDNGGETLDRYTAVYTMLPERKPKTYSAVGMSSYPFSPQGFGQHCTAMLGRHLGKKIEFKALPTDCKKLILQDLQDLINCAPDRPMGL